MAGAVLRTGVRWRAPGGLLRAVRAAFASAGVLAVLGGTGWLAVAAAQRPSVLSPPSMRPPGPPLLHQPGAWVLGPLHGLLPGLTTVVSRLHSDFVVVLVVTGAGWALAWVGAPALRARVLLGASALARRCSYWDRRCR